MSKLHSGMRSRKLPPHLPISAGTTAHLSLYTPPVLSCSGAHPHPNPAVTPPCPCPELPSRSSHGSLCLILSLQIPAGGNPRLTHDPAPQRLCEPREVKAEGAARQWPQVSWFSGSRGRAGSDLALWERRTVRRLPRVCIETSSLPITSTIC